MSCSLCRLPFVPSPRSVDPHYPPQDTFTVKGAFDAKRYNYFMWAIGIGRWIPGVVTPLEFLDNNMFGGMPAIPLVLNVQWETDGGTVMMLHTVCSSILRHIFEATDTSVESLTKLSEIELVLGRAIAGRLNYANYEGVGEDKVDLRPFLIPGPGHKFDWNAFMASGLAWTLTRPDVFPKFCPTVSPARLAALGPLPESTSDKITTLPMDVLHDLLEYLTNESFVSLLSTCRLLRRHALTSFQPQARARVIALEWAVPLASEHAAAAAARQKSGGAAAPMAHPVESPVDGDWLLYLSHVHRTQSMRARRWVWAVAREVRRAYGARLPDTEYADIPSEHGKLVKSKAQRTLEKEMEQFFFMNQVMHNKMSKEQVDNAFSKCFPGKPFPR